MEALIAVTYRCNAKCHMCNIWQHQTSEKDEITLEQLERLPNALSFANITGGEPFLREDIEEIVDIVLPKTERLVISTNGYFTDKVIRLAKKHPQIGIRVSTEGLPHANDELRGLKDGFDHGMRTLLALHKMGMKDIGFGVTVSDKNAKDMLELYHLSKCLGFEFATAAVHNSYYFHKHDNEFTDRQLVTGEFKKLIAQLLKSKKPKDWFRAYFNYGLINYVHGRPRLLPCEMGSDVFFMDPYGEIYPCNGMDWSMGNIKKKDFASIWGSEQARIVRAKVKTCTKNCWMVGSASPAIKKAMLPTLKWIVKNRFSKEIDYSCVEPLEC
jgi:Fe-coproporphyrin III synthase